MVNLADALRIIPRHDQPSGRRNGPDPPSKYGDSIIKAPEYCLVYEGNPSVVCQITTLLNKNLFPYILYFVTHIAGLG